MTGSEPQSNSTAGNGESCAEAGVTRHGARKRQRMSPRINAFRIVATSGRCMLSLMNVMAL